MIDPTPEQIDAWRWEQAQKPFKRYGVYNSATDYAMMREYRRMVRENVLPPANHDIPEWANDVAQELFRVEADQHEIYSGIDALTNNPAARVAMYAFARYIARPDRRHLAGERAA